MKNSSCKLKPADQVQTAPLIATGLIGGWLTARETGIRPLGGALLAAAGIYAGRSWWKKSPATCAALSASYIAAFGLSHPLAKKIGPWPAVLSVTGAASAAAYLLNDAK